jgi:hypothetical protein
MRISGLSSGDRGIGVSGLGWKRGEGSMETVGNEISQCSFDFRKEVVLMIFSNAISFLIL